MSKDITEQEVLERLDIPDFRHITKEKVMSFATMLNEMNPEVAIKAIEQFPDFVKLSLDALADYRNTLEKVLEANSDSGKACFNVYNEVIAALNRCLEKDNISFDEKKYYIDKMMEIAKMAEEKDSQNKAFYWKIIGGFAVVAVSALGAGVALLGGDFNINTPNLKK